MVLEVDGRNEDGQDDDKRVRRGNDDGQRQRLKNWSRNQQNVCAGADSKQSTLYNYMQAPYAPFGYWPEVAPRVAILKFMQTANCRMVAMVQRTSI